MSELVCCGCVGVCPVEYMFCECVLACVCKRKCVGSM